MTDEATRDGSTDGATTDARPKDAEAHDGRTSPELSVAPADALIDEPLDVTLAGLRPGQRVTVASEFVESRTRWRCEATFEADDEGVVDLTERAPVGGDYAGVRPTGLVQFATPEEDVTVEDDGGDEYRLRLTARVNGTSLAETTVTRRVCSPGVERVELDPDRDGIVGELYVPAGDGPHPGVVALHGSGGEPEVRFAEALASRGFATLALRYFGDPDPVPDRLAEVPISYVGRAIDRLKRRDAVAAADVGVLGVSRGTEAAFLAAARRDDVGVVIAYAPSAYAWPGRGGEGEEGPPPSAWTVDGDPLPILPHPGEAASPERTERGLRPRAMFEAFVEHASADALAASALPVEGIDADVLLLSGGDDRVWQAAEMAETVAERLRNAGTAGDVTHLSYDDAGHHAGVPYQPTAERTVVATDEGPDVVHGGTPEGIAEAEVDAWTAVLDALDGLAGEVPEDTGG